MMKQINDLEGIKKEKARNSMLFLVFMLGTILFFCISFFIWEMLILAFIFGFFSIYYLIEDRYWSLKSFILYGKWHEEIKNVRKNNG